MSRRHWVVAPEGFAGAGLQELVGIHPHVHWPGVVRPNTRLWSDDPIVLAHPTMFYDDPSAPPEEPAPAMPQAGDDLWAKPEWLEILKAYRACSDSRPSQNDVAEKMGLSEQSVRDRLRRLGIRDWRAVHALIAAGEVS
ncbi:MAG: winged helix-turn-helix domain-containing protein [Candidatus Limnocylindrales bacterium]